MFFILPVGSEEGVRRLPYLTIGLIALNAIIWIITSMVLSSQIEELDRLHTRMLEIENYYTYRLSDTDPALLDEADYDRIRERISAGDIIPPGTEDFQRWTNLYDKYQRKNDQLVFNQFGVTPARFNVLKLFSSLFVHANFFHLFFNMLFLWLVGCNIEDDWGWKVFLGVYLASGLVAGIFHVLAFPGSPVPLIGASGAIAGIMGAFLIRHYKTKIRFAYFFLLIIRPYFGTFSIYAGIVLPVWLLQQVLGVALGAESGTAYWAHIGGFVFGALTGASFKILGIEEKYIAPMVEDSFEKLKLSPRMKEVYRLLDAGATGDALPLLVQITDEERYNHEAPLILARLHEEAGRREDAARMYDRALAIALRTADDDIIVPLHDELDERDHLKELSERTLYGLADRYEASGRHEEAVRLFSLYMQVHRTSPVRPKAIYRMYSLFKDKMNETAKAEKALAYLRKEYPDWLRE